MSLKQKIGPNPGSRRFYHITMLEEHLSGTLQEAGRFFLARYCSMQIQHQWRMDQEQFDSGEPEQQSIKKNVHRTANVCLMLTLSH